MTGSFDERRKTQEEKWAHDEDLKFKIHARRDKLLGEWAAVEMGLKGPQMHVTHSDHMIRRQMDALLKIAQEQVMSEKKR
jgi:hypothetical protein